MDRFELRAVLAQAFARKMASQPETFSAKRRPSLDPRKGPEAADEWATKHIYPNSSIRKRMRAGRIARGARPFKCEVLGKRERKALAKGK